MEQREINHSGLIFRPAQRKRPVEFMKISEILQNKGSDVISMSQSTNVAKAALVLSQQAIGASVVIDEDGTLIGLLS